MVFSFYTDSFRKVKTEAIYVCAACFICFIRLSGLILKFRLNATSYVQILDPKLFIMYKNNTFLFNLSLKVKKSTEQRDLFLYFIS